MNKIWRFLYDLGERATRGIDLSDGSLSQNLGTLAAWGLLLILIISVVILAACVTTALEWAVDQPASITVAVFLWSVFLALLLATRVRSYGNVYRINISMKDNVVPSVNVRRKPDRPPQKVKAR